MAKILLAASATLAAGGILVITLFVAASGWPLLQQTGWWAFVSGRVWSPGTGVFGILPMIAGSVLVTLGALVFGCGLGLPAAIYLAEFAPRRLAGAVRQGVQLLAGIPSVVYGFYALTVLVPLIRRVSSGSGYSVLTGGIVLGVMILPTVVSLSEDAIAGVPAEHRLGALALGATRWQTMVRVLLPAARSGLVAAIILAAGRAVGETMAVIMVTGNVARFPSSLFDPVRTLTGNIALEMAYAAGEHQEALFATGLVLFLFTMSLNLLARAAGRRKRPG
ncbi:MAG: phosphate ABC transporter permease subunit PstC [bacterium]|nr:phosphate ABC transporter permease subunit PstC [bacterium]